MLPDGPQPAVSSPHPLMLAVVWFFLLSWHPKTKPFGAKAPHSRACYYLGPVGLLACVAGEPLKGVWSVLAKADTAC